MKPYVELEVAKAEVEKIVKDCMVLAKKSFSNNLITPNIVWKARGFRTAGWAYYKTQYRMPYIEMNTNFLYSKDAKRFIQNTIRHELAHILADEIYGVCGQGHNRYWRNVCYVIGDDGARCHDYAKPDNCTTKRFELDCKCGAHFSLSTRAYNKAKVGGYLCRCCHTNLKDLIYKAD